MPELSPEDWAQIRQEYEAEERTVTAICADFNVTNRSLYDHASREGWRLRQGDRSGPLVGPSAARRRTLVGRLCALFEQQLNTIEDQGIGADRLANLERDCRALDSLARTFDRIVQAELRALDAKKSGADMTSNGEPTDQEGSSTDDQSNLKTLELRRENLAERLFGLREQAGHSEAVGDTQPR